LEKSKDYISNKISNFSISKSSVLLYLNSWDPSSLGCSLLKWKMSLQKSSFWFFIKFCKNIISIRNYSKLRLHFGPKYSRDSNFDSLIISWCKYSDFDNLGNYHDRYFNVQADKHSHVLWLLISIDGKLPSSLQPNIGIYFKKKVALISEIFFVFKCIMRAINSSKGKWVNFLNNISAEQVFAEKITLVTEALNTKHAFCSLIQPYEAHPFQHAITLGLKNSDKGIKSIGYLHSVLPALPTDLIYREGAPDVLYVHGQGQIDIMENFLNWPSSDLRFIPSLRFKREIFESFSGFIFLPYNFSDSKSIVKGLKSYFETIDSDALPKMLVRCHPAKSNSKKHISLMNEIDLLLKKQYVKFNDQSDRKISIFIGATAAIVEALERGMEVIHITSDPIFESHQEDLWADLEVTNININVLQYKLNKLGSYVYLGKLDDDILKFLHLK
jgi:hypothetical protein